MISIIALALRRLMSLQERKSALSRAAFDRRSVDRVRDMRIEDLRLLMSV